MKRVLISLLVGCVVLGVGCGEEKVSKADYDTLQKSYNDTVKELERVRTSNSILESENNVLNSKIENAKDYFELDPTEKELVDAKIKEVNEATETQKAEEKAKREEEEKVKKAAEEEAKRQAEAHKYETGLTWEQIAREGKVGTLGKFEGKIIQVMNNGSWTSYRIAVNGDYDQIMYVEDTLNRAAETLLEDDYVYFKGMSEGTTTYTTIMGAKVTIPAFMVDEITR